MGRNKVRLTFSELNNHTIWGKLSLTTTVLFLGVVICHNENKSNNIDLEIALLFAHTRNDDLSVEHTVPEGPLFFPPHHYCCDLEINPYS